MRVNPNSSPISSGVASESQATKKTKTENVDAKARDAAETRRSGTSSTEISSRAKDMASAKQVASDTPDVREAKIAELRDKIQNKKYDVSADAISDRLVDDHIRMAGA